MRLKSADPQVLVKSHKTSELNAEWRFLLPQPFPDLFSVERANINGVTNNLRLIMAIMGASLQKIMIHTKLNELGGETGNKRRRMVLACHLCFSWFIVDSRAQPFESSFVC